MLARPTCSSCRFWDQVYPEARVGFCRINPPVIVPLPEFREDYLFEGQWPATNEADWCGRHAWQETPRQPVAEDPGRGGRGRVNAVEGGIPGE